MRSTPCRKVRSSCALLAAPHGAGRWSCLGPAQPQALACQCMLLGPVPSLFNASFLLPFNRADNDKMIAGIAEPAAGEADLDIRQLASASALVQASTHARPAGCAPLMPAPLHACAAAEALAALCWQGCWGA